jgi:hypothetical protein
VRLALRVTGDASGASAPLVDGERGVGRMAKDAD